MVVVEAEVEEERDDDLTDCVILNYITILLMKTVLLGILLLEYFITC